MKNKTYTWLDIIAKGAQIVTSICLLIIALVTLRINSTSFIYNFRPYVGLEIGNASQELLPDFKYSLHIINKGNFPANHVKISFDPKSPGLLSISGIYSNITPPTIIFPGQDLTSYFYIHSNQETIQRVMDNKLEFNLHVTITYDGIGTKNHITEYYYLYSPQRKILEIVNGKAT